MEKVILFGASNLGKMACNLLKSKYEICYFCDNNEQKWGESFCDIKIISPTQLRIYKTYKIIITSIYFIEILKQLRIMEVYDISIFFMDDKSDMKYKLIDSEKYAFENLNINKSFKKKYVRDFSLLYNTEKNDQKRILVNSGLKNILIIAYFFPPLGGAGVQRTLKFVKYLREFGWEPIVITCGNNDYYIHDYTLLDEIPEGVNIIRIDDNSLNNILLNKELIQQNINLYYGLVDDEVLMHNYIAKFKNTSANSLGECILPDKNIGWTNEVLKSIENIIDINNIDLIYSTSAPYSDHIIGYYLKKKYNKPWVTDFRDEWTNNHVKFYNKESLEYQLEFNMETKITKCSDFIVTTTSISENNYIKLFKLHKDKVKAITNGYDESDFVFLYEDTNETQICNSNIFKLMFNGSFYNTINPFNLIISINNLIESQKINSNKINIIIIGKSSEDIIQTIKKIDKFQIVKFCGYMNHHQSLKEISEAEVLFLTSGSNTKSSQCFPGKVFEYLRLCRPILSFSHKNGELDNLINCLDRGYNVDASNIDEIEKIVLNLYKRWENNNLPIYSLNNEIKKFDRRYLTKQLAKIFDIVIDN